MKYFTGCKTLDELKKEYRRLALENHPDRGGDESTMKAINAEYEATAKQITDNAPQSEQPKHKPETPEVFIEIIDKLIRMSGVEIEICGSWIWVSGNTFVHRTEISEVGFKYSKTKKAWYWFNGISETHRRRGTTSLNEIRKKYGSEMYIGKELEALEA